MRLKTLELHGFKSFAPKTVLQFENSIVAIVGPNGSGKSNVVEAVRFALGEQSMKSMRGKGGTDLIFKGSKNLSRASRASVAAYFDNRDKIFKLANDAGEDLSLNYDTISIAREVYTDGVNKYILNGSEVRLKDIHGLLASVHIGSSGHHIISQGEADRILSAPARDRKAMVEDALGLRLYQYKIKESERKLERTTENMKEVTLLRRENAPHLKFLEKQEEKFERANPATPVRVIGNWRPCEIWNRKLMLFAVRRANWNGNSDGSRACWNPERPKRKFLAAAPCAAVSSRIQIRNSWKNGSTRRQNLKS